MKTATLFILYYDMDVSGVTQKIIDIINYPMTETRFGKVIIIARRRGVRSMEGEIRNKNVRIYYYSDIFLSKLPFCFPLFVFYLTLLYKPKSMLAFCFIPSLVAALTKIIFSNHFQLTVSITEDYRGLDKELSYNVPLIRKILLGLIGQKADTIIAINHTIMVALERTYGFPKNKILLIRNWYKPSYAEHSPLSATSFDLVYVGRMERDKNIMFVLKAIKAMVKRRTPVSFCIVGSGSEEQSVQRYIIRNRLAPQVFLAGFTLNTISYLKKSSIFVLPSDNEGSPLALLDAMHYGLPVLCWHFPGVKEIVTGGRTGYIFHNQKELIERLYFLLHHPAARSLMGKRAGAYVHRLYNPKNIRSYLTCLSS